MSKGQKPLNYDFEALSKKDWIEKIELDLKGKSYDSLKSDLEEGFEVEPVYTSEDFLADYNFDWETSDWAPNKNRAWFLGQRIPTNHLNQSILEYCNEYGIDTLDLSGEKNATEDIFNLLSKSALKLIFCKPDFLGPDKISQLNQSNKKVIIEPDFAESILNSNTEDRIKSSSKGFGAISINLSSLISKGLSSLEESALLLSLINDLHSSEVINTKTQVVLRLSMGSNFYLNIVRIRVVRKLGNFMLKEMGISNPIIIECHTGEFNKAIYDRDTNMLRNTSESFAALAAGTDILGIHQFDEAFSYSNEFGIRNAANISNLLEFESHLDKSDDMAQGSYALEKLSVDFAEKVWDKFLSISQKGGTSKYCDRDFLTSLSENKKDLESTFSNQKIKMTGTNIFPNSLETISEEEMESINQDRLSSSFDSIRLRLDKYSSNNKGDRIKAHLIRIGSHPKRFARATFSANFLASAGFECLYTDEIPKEIGEKDLIVLCGDDSDYNQQAIEALAEFPNAKIIAGNPDNKEELTSVGVNFFIHLGAALEERLRSILTFIQL